MSVGSLSTKKDSFNIWAYGDDLVIVLYSQQAEGSYIAEKVWHREQLPNWKTSQEVFGDYNVSR